MEKDELKDVRHTLDYQLGFGAGYKKAVDDAIGKIDGLVDQIGQMLQPGPEDRCKVCGNRNRLCTCGNTQFDRG